MRNKFFTSCLKRIHEIECMLKDGPKNIQPYAYMRVFNESETIGITLKTLLQGGGSERSYRL